MFKFGLCCLELIKLWNDFTTESAPYLYEKSCWCWTIWRLLCEMNDTGHFIFQLRWRCLWIQSTNANNDPQTYPPTTTITTTPTIVITITSGSKTTTNNTLCFWNRTTTKIIATHARQHRFYSRLMLMFQRHCLACVKWWWWWSWCCAHDFGIFVVVVVVGSVRSALVHDHFQIRTPYVQAK